MLITLILITPFVASLLSLFVQKKTGMLHFLAIAASVMELMVGVVIAAEVMRNGSYSLDGLFVVDALGAILVLTLVIVGAMVSWYSTGYLKAEAAKEIIGFHRVRQYFVLLHLFLLAMFFAIMTISPLFMWIAIEATTLSTAFLISFYHKPSALEAAWKYLIINSVGLLLGFLGTLLFLYPAIQAGFRGLSTWQGLLDQAESFDPAIAKIAFIFVMVGYGTKVGLVPMHTWLPDAHSKAPAPISGLLSGMLLNVAFLAILRFKQLADAAVGIYFSQSILIFFGITSIVVAAFFIFGQKNYKRLLAYSSIEHMGIISLGFGFGGTAAFAGLLHMIYHSFAKSLLFLSAGNILLTFSSTKIKKVKGVLSVLPVTAILFMIGFLVITGVPPFGIFITEFSIISVGIQTYPIVTIITLFALTLAFAGFLRHVVGMIFGDSQRRVVKEKAVSIVPIAVLAFILIVSSVFIPQAISTLITAATSAH
ncbi:hydrogenase 4 subunit F [Candidatus Uhrbacteria bacterium]|nr:hydrogenase 4 subunit F [Candidatus Uhrbacteria bacterium]